jgi:hypothetical protein
MILGQSFPGEKFVWVVGFEGNFIVSFGPKPGFRLRILPWTKLNKNEMSEE